MKKTGCVFISGDGANRLKSLGETLRDTLRAYQSISVIQVLDKFQMAKYLNSIFAHVQTAFKLLRKIIDTITPEPLGLWLMPISPLAKS